MAIETDFGAETTTDRDYANQRNFYKIGSRQSGRENGHHDLAATRQKQTSGRHSTNVVFSG
jgi:hypothetical protein